MVLVSPPESTKFDSIVDDGVCHIFDPAELDCDAPPSENQHVLSSDIWFKLEEME